MRTRLRFDIAAQPDNTTCGPTCLTSIYHFYGDHVPLAQVIDEIDKLETGGTLAVIMGNHALRRGYLATIYTNNLQVFDPSWFTDEGPIPNIVDKLRAQAQAKSSERLHSATRAYIDFLGMGGQLLYGDITTSLIRKHLKRKNPILAGLSATYLYRSAREVGVDPELDDIRGEPSGHFVVLSGYDKNERSVLVSDPLYPNPFAKIHSYEQPIHRVIASILLGVLTHDANLLVITPNMAAQKLAHADLPRR